MQEVLKACGASVTKRYISGDKIPQQNAEGVQSERVGPNLTCIKGGMK